MISRGKRSSKSKDPMATGAAGSAPCYHRNAHRIIDDLYRCDECGSIVSRDDLNFTRLKYIMLMMEKLDREGKLG